ncbi:MAG: alpha/beta hydrolase [Acidobacteriota bacterium]|nr:alpha/beta hydrolase [Acidobacteriota bacterium]
MMRLLSLAIAVLVLSSPVPAQQPAVVSAGEFRIGGGETVAADHGHFTVPVNRHRPESGSMTLRFVRFRSTAARPGAPIVFLAGGPGDAATRAFAGLPRTFLDPLRAIADVIAFDQRGTGTSGPRVLCPPGAAQSLDAPLDPAALVSSMTAALAVCLPRLAVEGIDIAGFTTEESADDVDDLRKAIGARQIMLLGGSYGTHLALSVARRHPDAVARMALLGVEGPDDTIKRPSGPESALTEIDRVHPGLVTSLRTLIARLSAEPWTKTLPGGQRVTVGAWDLQRRVADALDTTREIEALVPAVAGMMGGDYSDLVRWTIPFRAARPINVMNLAMDCASFASPARLRDVRAGHSTTLLGAAMNAPLPDVCAAPGLPRLPDSFRAPRVSRVPALLVAGTWDGRTPPANAHAAASRMTNAEVLIVPRGSHGLFQEASVLDAVLRFLAR